MPNESWMPRTGWCCRAASTCIPISTCPLAALPAPTISRPARAPPLLAEPPRSLTLPSNTKANRCELPSIPGCRRPLQKPLLITPSTALSPIFLRRGWTRWMNWCAKASRASSCLWLTRESSCWMMPPSSRPCAVLQKSEA